MKRIFSFLFLLVLCATFMFAKSADKADASAEQDLPALIIKGKDLNKKEGLVYSKLYTLYESDDRYGKYDIYSDDEKNEYRYLQSTNKLCGIYFPGYSTRQYDPSKHIPEKEVIKIADEWLKRIMGEDNAYIFVKSEYSDSRKIYEVFYGYYIGESKTDDEVVIAIDPFGELFYMKAFNRDRYAKVNQQAALKSIGKINTAAKIEDFTKTADYKINDEYISKDLKGNLVMKYRVSYNNRTEIVEVPIRG